MGDAAISPLNISWAHSLRQARARAGLTQVDLARSTGISQQLISQYEGGLVRPTDERRILLARALGTTIAELFPYPDDDSNGSDTEAA